VRGVRVRGDGGSHAFLREIIEDELGSVPSRFTTRLAQAADVADGILEETAASRMTWSSSRFRGVERPHPSLGTVDDRISEQIACSVLLVRRYEPAAISWIKRQVKM